MPFESILCDELAFQRCFMPIMDPILSVLAVLGITNINILLLAPIMYCKCCIFSSACEDHQDVPPLFVELCNPLDNHKISKKQSTTRLLLDLYHNLLEEDLVCFESAQRLQSSIQVHN